MGLMDRLTGKVTLDQFAAELMKAIRAAGCTNELRYEDGQIVRLSGGKTVGVTNPGNMLHGYAAASREERPELLRKFTQVAVMSGRRPPEDFEKAKPDLRTRLWTRASLEFERLRGVIGEGREIDLVAVPVGEHLYACLAYDWPDTDSSIPPSLLEEWGVTLYEAMEVAAANLDAATEGMPRTATASMSSQAATATTPRGSH